MRKRYADRCYAEPPAILHDRYFEWRLVSGATLEECWPYAYELDEQHLGAWLSPDAAQGPRIEITLDGKTYPGVVAFGCVKSVLVRTGLNETVMTELPPPPRIGEWKPDQRAKKLHGQLVHLSEYWAWFVDRIDDVQLARHQTSGARPDPE